MIDAKARQELAVFFEAHGVPFDPDFSLERCGLRRLTLDEYRDQINTIGKHLPKAVHHTANRPKASPIWRRFIGGFAGNDFRHGRL